MCVLKRNRKILKFLPQNHISGGNFMRRIDCAHSRILKMLPWPWFREGIGVLKRKSNIFRFLWENRRFLGFSRRRIYCTHSQSLKMLPWSWFREMSVLYWSENMKILDFSSKIIVLRVILCEKSIQRISEASKCILDHRPWKIMFLPQLRWCAESISRIQ